MQNFPKNPLTNIYGGGIIEYFGAKEPKTRRAILPLSAGFVKWQNDQNFQPPFVHFDEGGVSLH